MYALMTSTLSLSLVKDMVKDMVKGLELELVLSDRGLRFRFR